MNVILTGLRGTGKSSVGKVLAQRLNFVFVDTDARIEELAGYQACGGKISTRVSNYGHSIQVEGRRDGPFGR